MPKKKLPTKKELVKAFKDLLRWGYFKKVGEDADGEPIYELTEKGRTATHVGETKQ